MKLSTIYRVLLLGLLPAIGVFIYMEGQKFDPALLEFQSEKPSTNPLSSFFPEKIAPYHRLDGFRLFTRDNLYEYVDGHAEYFISAGFQQLGVGEYALPGSDVNKPAVTVEIYDMGKYIQAFGLLSDESEGKIASLKTGAAGFKTPQGVSFVKGPYFVKILAYNNEVPLDHFTKGIDSQIHAHAQTLSEFSRLPNIGKVVQTRFIKEAYRGLDFVNNVIEREYDVNGKEIQIFMSVGNQADINRLVTSFIAFFRESEIKFEPTNIKGTQIYKVDDPYEGNWVLIPLSDVLFGVYGDVDSELIADIITGSPKE